MSAFRHHLRALRLRLHDERGHTLVELLMAAALMIVVLGGTLGILDSFWRLDRRNTQMNGQQDEARNTLDQLSRELRNGTAYSIDSSAVQSVLLKADPTDLIFKTVDPNNTPASGATNAYGVQRVRYCLAGGRLYRDVQQWTGPTPDLPTDTSCPGSGWTSSRVVVQDISNTAAQPIFTYGPPGAETLADYATISAQLYVDTDPSSGVHASRLTTGVSLRNQNQKPTVLFTATATTNYHVQLNGSASADPEGAPLTYKWEEDGTPIGESTPTFDYIAPATGDHTFTLTVTDPGGLSATMTRPVTVRN